MKTGWTKYERPGTGPLEVAWETTGTQVFNAVDLLTVVRQTTVRTGCSPATPARSRPPSSSPHCRRPTRLRGVHAFSAEGQLHSDLRRRVRRTAQFLVYVMTPSTAFPNRRPPEFSKDKRYEKLPKAFWTAFEASVSLRLFHHALRTQLKVDAGLDPGPLEPSPFERFLGALGGDAPWDPVDADAIKAKRAALGPMNWEQGVPLNQEDLLGTLLTFSITVFETLHRFGIPWTAAEQESYLTAWDVIGSWLGIGTKAVLDTIDKDPVARDQSVLERETIRPMTVEDARSWLEQLRNRQWLSISTEPVKNSLNEQWAGLQPGRLLVRALLDELSEVMPRRRAGWPLSVMRQLANNDVHDRLGLGGGGIVQAAVDSLPRRSTMIDDFTSLRVRNRVGGHALRYMANSVTQQTVIHFVEQGDPPFDFPILFDDHHDRLAR